MGSGADAVLGYERWRDAQDEAELDAIAAYNEEDCRATLALRDWLLDVRPAGTAGSGRSRRRYDERGRRGRRRARGCCGTRSSTARSRASSAGWPASCSSTTAARRGRRGGGTSRCREMDEERAHATTARRSPASSRPARRGRQRRRARADRCASRAAGPQDRARARAIDPATGRASTSVGSTTTAGIVVDPARQEVARRAAADGARARGGRIDRRRSAARSCGSRQPCATRRPVPRAAGRCSPRAAAVLGGRRRRADPDHRSRGAATPRARARPRARSSCKARPAPARPRPAPGSIVDLIAHGQTGRRHRAEPQGDQQPARGESSEAADEERRQLRGARKAASEDELPRAATAAASSTSSDNAGCLSDELPPRRRHDLAVRATSAFDGAFDYLVIDEAGQLSLADALAAGTQRANLILLGDPLQLPQVSQAIHPAGHERERARAPARRARDRARRTRAVPRPRRWRMHPDVCRFISDEVYEGRLQSYPQCARADRRAPAPASASCPSRTSATHRSRREEAERVRARIAGLLGQPYTRR